MRISGNVFIVTGGNADAAGMIQEQP
ncbi:hypothetical protein CBM2615_B60113 [Cupriavidus taiwanensis]|uniref:Uncharacterized protein n=1 Tax=Cupriavidus taiwanensis TaxID=164546 RepID=A0A375EE99_9BURK|nr:hypothetical protein CBM2614_B50106 [Cupriavidus taiwanensis]SOZ69781.1 hypothetical protein CBM2615_B60113 [Cupriavidus taiwanensis]SOZ72967.1 hypothetical protein CBM2613_B50109 [Cupriavidus taiwanensis]SPA09869.1 hypothetical protein CBM2625_B60025 [Cupriavidus taiwanensis]